MLRDSSTGRFIKHKNLSQRTCVACDGTKSILGAKGYELWRNHDGDKFCKRCYDKYVRDIREKSKKRYLKVGKNRICFKTKLHQLLECPRKGLCSWCHKKIGDIYIDCYGKEAVIKRTHMHHLKYHPEDVLKDAIELCVSCHMKESRRLKSIKNGF